MKNGIEQKYYKYELYQTINKLLNIIFRFHHIETWMTTVERSMADTQNIDLPSEQYKLLVNKFTVCNLFFKLLQNSFFSLIE